MARGRKSAAALKREALGLNPPKDPVKQAAGRAGRAKQMAKNPKRVAHSKAIAQLPAGGRAALDQAQRDAFELRAKTKALQGEVGAWAIRFSCENVPKVLKMLMDIVEDDGQAAKDRISAGKAVIEVSGIGEHSKAAAGLTDKPITEWTLGDLQAQVASLESELSHQVIDSTAEVIEG